MENSLSVSQSVVQDHTLRIRTGFHQLPSTRLAEFEKEIVYHDVCVAQFTSEKRIRAKKFHYD